ncbi:amidohydrolase family protein [Amycolatopsis sacchari]|uniref:Predicted metal-dependent hydrolase, TIM-barrel fold n=1 Tax=Amycolatopsis sacchari TaxID=115433 RepID=A0A1I3UE58_9PSEU|nr:amidohydrolase family protein [Amycolatopsis sacchari]SFJ81320.1 Predicted metal-dependent hydrolase, TIM-barrel fold [Amycolatopsis sacchari]
MPAEAATNLLIDTDVHPHLGDLSAYLPRVWGERWKRIAMGVGAAHEGNPRGVPRRDAWTPDGRLPGSDPEFMVTDHLDRYDIDYAILLPPVLPMIPDPDYANALASAYNDCLLDSWLPVSARFKGSVAVNSNDPEAAAREIRRVGSHPDMVQVLMSSVSRAPYGQRQYHAIYEAAAEFDLPVAVHPGTEGAGTAWPPTPVGYPSRYLEWHNILPITYMAQINSLICEGVFEKFPTLKFVGVEGGLAWLPHLMWRMDKNYKALRDTTPWLKRLPSEYIVEHIRFTTQPIEEPAKPAELEQILSMISAEKTVMFSSDYPHWDNDDPRLVLRRLDPAMRARIFGGTAAELYQLHTAPARTEPTWQRTKKTESKDDSTSYATVIE